MTCDRSGTEFSARRERSRLLKTITKTIPESLLGSACYNSARYTLSQATLEQIFNSITEGSTKFHRKSITKFLRKLSRFVEPGKVPMRMAARRSVPFSWGVFSWVQNGEPFGFLCWEVAFCRFANPCASLVKAVRGLPRVAMLIPRTELVSTKQVAKSPALFWCYFDAIVIRVWFLILLREVPSIWSCDQRKAHCS